jgi:DNA-binding transcriptional LysR family regulator
VGAGRAKSWRVIAAEGGEALELGTAERGNPSTLTDHFARHGADFGANSEAGYAGQAFQFLQRSQGEDLLTQGRYDRAATLKRSFTIRSNEGFVEIFAAPLVAAVTVVAPNVRLHFAPKPDKDVRALREGIVDLEIGVLGESGPEVRLQALFREHFVGAVREGHPLLKKGKMTAERYAACGHVVASRRGLAHGPVDKALAEHGLARTIVAVVPGFRAALAVASGSDLVAQVTSSFINAIQAGRLRSFPLPVRTEGITISQMWHPRLEADPAHRWLRGLVLTICREHALNSPQNESGG